MEGHAMQGFREFGEHDLGEGRVYQGECLDGKPTGTGVLFSTRRFSASPPLCPSPHKDGGQGNHGVGEEEDDDGGDDEGAAELPGVEDSAMPQGEYRGQIVGGKPNGWGLFLFPDAVAQRPLSGDFRNGRHCVSSCNEEADDQAWPAQREAVANMFEMQRLRSMPRLGFRGKLTEEVLASTFAVDPEELVENLSYIAQCLDVARAPIDALSACLDASRQAGLVNTSLSVAHGTLLHPEYRCAYTILMRETLSIVGTEDRSDRYFVLFNSPSLSQVRTQDDLRFLVDDITSELSPQHIASLLMTGSEVWISGHSLGATVAYVFAMEVVWRLLSCPQSAACLARLHVFTLGQAMLPCLSPDLETMVKTNPPPRTINIAHLTSPTKSRADTISQSLQANRATSPSTSPRRATTATTATAPVPEGEAAADVFPATGSEAGDAGAQNGGQHRHNDTGEQVQAGEKQGQEGKQSQEEGEEEWQQERDMVNCGKRERRSVDSEGDRKPQRQQDADAMMGSERGSRSHDGIVASVEDVAGAVGEAQCAPVEATDGSGRCPDSNTTQCSGNSRKMRRRGRAGDSCSHSDVDRTSGGVTDDDACSSDGSHALEKETGKGNGEEEEDGEGEEEEEDEEDSKKKGSSGDVTAAGMFCSEAATTLERLGLREPGHMSRRLTLAGTPRSRLYSKAEVPKRAVSATAPAPAVVLHEAGGHQGRASATAAGATSATTRRRTTSATSIMSRDPAEPGEEGIVSEEEEEQRRLVLRTWCAQRAFLIFCRGDVFPFVYGLQGGVEEVARLHETITHDSRFVEQGGAGDDASSRISGGGGGGLGGNKSGSSSSGSSNSRKHRAFKFKMTVQQDTFASVQVFARELMQRHATFFGLGTQLARAEEYGYEMPWLKLLPALYFKRGVAAVQLGKGRGQTPQVMHMWRTYHDHVRGAAKSLSITASFAPHAHVATNELINEPPGLMRVSSRVAMLRHGQLRIFLVGTNLNLTSDVEISVALVVGRERRMLTRTLLIVEPPTRNFGANGSSYMELDVAVPQDALLDVHPDFVVRTDAHNPLPSNRHFLRCRLRSAFGEATVAFNQRMLLTGTWTAHRDAMWEETFSVQSADLLIRSTLLSALLAHQVKQRCVLGEFELEEDHTRAMVEQEDVNVNIERCVALDALKRRVDLATLVQTFQHAQSHSGLGVLLPEMQSQFRAALLAAFPVKLNNASEEERAKQREWTQRHIQDTAIDRCIYFHHLLLPDEWLGTLRCIVNATRESVVFPSQDVPLDSLDPPSIPLLPTLDTRDAPPPHAATGAEDGTANTSSSVSSSHDAGITSNVPMLLFHSFFRTFKALDGKQLIDPSNVYFFHFLWKCEPVVRCMINYWDGRCYLPVARKNGRRRRLMRSAGAAAYLGMRTVFARMQERDTGEALPEDRPASVTAQTRLDAVRRSASYRIREVDGEQGRLAFIADLLYPGAGSDIPSCDLERMLLHLFSENQIPGPGCLKYIAGQLTPPDRSSSSSSADRRGGEAGTDGDVRLQRAAARLQHLGAAATRDDYTFRTVVDWIATVTSIKRPLCRLRVAAPLIAVIGPQGVGKTQLVQTLGFDVKPAFGGDANTKAFDSFVFPGTNVMLVDCLAFTEALGGRQQQRKGSDAIFQYCGSTYMQAILSSARLVIVAFNNPRKNSQDAEELVRLLRYCAGDVVFLQTKMDQRFGEFLACMPGTGDLGDAAADDDANLTRHIFAHESGHRGNGRGAGGGENPSPAPSLGSAHPPSDHELAPEVHKFLLSCREMAQDKHELLASQLGARSITTRLFWVSRFGRRNPLLQVACRAPSPTAGILWNENHLRTFLRDFLVYDLGLTAAKAAKALGFSAPATTRTWLGADPWAL